MNCPMCNAQLVMYENDEAVELTCQSCDYGEVIFKCDCGSGETDTWYEYDAKGVILCLVCSKCREKRLSRYRPCILEGYDQSDVDEPIEPEE